MDYQLIVIGAGPGGYNAALRAAKLGLHTAVVENREAGGTCLNRGCVPTKTLLHASEIYKEAKEGAHAGIHAEGIRVDLEEMFAYKNQITAKLSAGIEGLLKSAKADLLHGTGKITAPGVVQVTDPAGTVTEYTAEKILIATGSVPVHLPIPGFELPGVMTSDELLEGADHLYDSIVIIGGGVIGIEFATFYRELGTKVTIVEGLDRLLPNMDKEISQNITQILKKQGVTVYTGSMVKGVEQTENGLKVLFTCKDAEQSAEGEAVLCSIGRKPYWDGLFAEDLQPETVRRSLKVDDRFETSIPGIYAIGDVSSKIQLAHVAAAQGIACVEMICGTEVKTDLNLVPSCIYCHPEIACVGMTEAEAKDAGIPVRVGKAILGGNARTMIADTGRAFMKVVAHAETQKLLGAQLMCEHSTDMISELGEAIANGAGPEQLLAAMRPHPTFEEALTDALEDLITKLNK